MSSDNKDKKANFNWQNYTSSIDSSTMDQIRAAAARMKNGTSPDRAKGGAPQSWSSIYSKAPQRRPNVDAPSGGNPLSNE